MTGNLRQALIVDDDPGIQTLLRVLLGRVQFVADSVAHGSEAIVRTVGTCYDIILLDLMLPGMNGFEVIRHWKNVQPEILKNVIVLTAASRSTLRDFEDERLVYKMIRKPFDIKELSTALIHCSEGREPRSANRVPPAVER